MSRCLVTGHKGYIGSRLLHKLKEDGHEVLGIDLKEEKDINSLQGLVEDNVGDFHPHWFAFKPEYIFHLACWPRIGLGIEEPVKTMKNNVLAGSNVLNFARKVGAKRVIYSSSSSIEGNGSGPTSPYALQKMVTEIECRLYSELYGLDTISLRYFNVYSEDQPADGPYATAISNWMSYIRQGKRPFITGDGTQRRDMLHVDDAVSANIFAMNRTENFSGKVYDVGTGKNISLNEVKDLVLSLFPHIQFVDKSTRPAEVLVTKANALPLKKIGWETKISIKDGIFRCFKELRNEI
tara:strand:- start:1090 stop:1971 length:882 start_codon:yes stop_codon:yes gene_type:complete